MEDCKRWNLERRFYLIIHFQGGGAAGKAIIYWQSLIVLEMSVLSRRGWQWVGERRDLAGRGKGGEGVPAATCGGRRWIGLFGYFVTLAAAGTCRHLCSAWVACKTKHFAVPRYPRCM